MFKQFYTEEMELEDHLYDSDEDSPVNMSILQKELVSNIKSFRVNNKSVLPEDLLVEYSIYDHASIVSLQSDKYLFSENCGNVRSLLDSLEAIALLNHNQYTQGMVANLNSVIPNVATVMGFYRYVPSKYLYQYDFDKIKVYKHKKIFSPSGTVYTKTIKLPTFLYNIFMSIDFSKIEFYTNDSMMYINAEPEKQDYDSVDSEDSVMYLNLTQSGFIIDCLQALGYYSKSLTSPDNTRLVLI